MHFSQQDYMEIAKHVVAELKPELMEMLSRIELKPSEKPTQLPVKDWVAMMNKTSGLDIWNEQKARDWFRLRKLTGERKGKRNIVLDVDQKFLRA